MFENNNFEELKSILQEKQKDHHLIMVGNNINSNLRTTSFIFYGSLQRSLWNTRDFLKNIDSSYILAAIILRSQLDTLIRLHAFSIYPNPDEMAEKILFKEEKLRSFTIIVKGKNEKLTDKFLHEQLNMEYDWISNVYNKLCDFAHLSEMHAKIPFELKDKKNKIREFDFSLTHEDSIKFTDDLRTEVTRCMAHTTDAILTYISDFVEKNKIN